MKGRGWKRDLQMAYAKARSSLSPQDVLQTLFVSFQRVGLNKNNISQFIRNQENGIKEELNDRDEQIAKNHETIKNKKKALSSSYMKEPVYQYVRENYVRDIKELEKENIKLKDEMKEIIRLFEAMKSSAYKYISMPRVEGTVVNEEDIEADVIIDPNQTMESELIQAIPVVSAYLGAEEQDPAMLRAMAESERMREEERRRRGEGIKRKGKGTQAMKDKMAYVRSCKK